MFDAMLSFLKSKKPLDHFGDILAGYTTKHPGLKTTMEEWRHESDEEFVKKVGKIFSKQHYVICIYMLLINFENGLQAV